MSEIFNEIDEDLRREQLKKLWERYSIFIIAGAILIIAAVGGWRGYQYLEAKKAAEAGDAAAADPKAAAKLYDAIAADPAVSASQQDLARIRAAGLLMESEPYAEMRQRLEPATGEGRTFRHTARELLALSAYRANDATAARQWLDMIGNDARTPASMRSRAEALQALLPPAAKS